MQNNEIIVKTRRQYITIVIVCAFILALFVFSPNGKYLWPIAVLILAPMFFFYRYADFYADRMVITYPLRKKKISVQYRELKKVRYRPAVFNNAPALVVWFVEKSKTSKYGFDIDSKDAPVMLELIKSNSPETVILDPWDDKPFNNK